MKNERLKMKLNGQELQQCPQCYTMKHMTRELCFRCLDRNEIEMQVRLEVFELIHKKFMSCKNIDVMDILEELQKDVLLMNKDKNYEKRKK
ncbi:MAG: hypothetical protein AABY22_12610 [Nanoarchaeota archaeon]